MRQTKRSIIGDMLRGIHHPLPMSLQMHNDGLVYNHTLWKYFTSNDGKTSWGAVADGLKKIGNKFGKSFISPSRISAYMESITTLISWREK